MATGKFRRGTNAGVKKCEECGVTYQRANIDMSTGLCTVGVFCCYDIEGERNAHSDGHHKGGCPENCPIAHPELDFLLNGTAYRQAQNIVNEDQAQPYQTWNIDYLAESLKLLYRLSDNAAYHVAFLAHERNKDRPYIGRSQFMEN